MDIRRALRRSGLASVLALSPILTGCFGLLGGGGDEAEAAVQVQNNLIPPVRVTVELERPDDDPVTLGSLDPNESRRLLYSDDELSGSYRLSAVQPSGAAVLSRAFTLFDGALVEWDLARNTLSVIQGR